MQLGRVRKNISATAWPGHRRAVAPLRALAEAEDLAGATFVSTFDELPSAGHRFASTAREVMGLLVGLTASGSRSAGYITGDSPTRILSEISSAAGSHLPLLLHHACGAVVTAAGASHDAFFALRDTGCFLLFAADAQEAVDLALIGHQIAEQALLPGVCSRDAFLGPHDLSTIRCHEPGLLERFLGNADDTILAPTSSQRLLFGNERRRIPRLLAVARPVGVGAALDECAAAKALAGQGPYFSEELAGIAAEAFTAFAGWTGREYSAVSGYRAHDADYLVVAVGNVIPRLMSVVDKLRQNRQKVGLVCVRMYRPFPGAAISHIIRGKKGITVLESTRTGFSQDPPMMADIRAVLDRSAENSQSRNTPQPYPGYALLDRKASRPVLYSAVSHDASGASDDDLRATFDNMQAGGAGTRRYHLGVRFGPPTTVRVPGLERLGQFLETAYEGLSLRGLKGAGRESRSDSEGTRIRILGLADQNVDDVGAAIATALFRAADGTVESRRRPGPMNSFDVVSCTVLHTPGDHNNRPAADKPNVIAVTRLRMLHDAELLRSVDERGTVLISSEDTPQAVWDRLPSRVREIIREKDLHLSLVPADLVADALSSDGWTKRQLAMQALAGGVTTAAAPLARSTAVAVGAAYRDALTEDWEAGNQLLGQFLQAFDTGQVEVSELDWKTLSPVEAEPEREPGAPWTVREAPVHDDTIYDAGRFWNAVGYLYQTGRSEETLTDPYVASGVIPGRTGAFRSWAPFTTQIPRFLAENCTACSSCFVSCPDSALPVTVGTAGELLDEAMNRAEESGAGLLQLRRLQKHLAAQAHKLIAGDERRVYLTLGDLISGAHQALTARVELTAEEAAQIKSEVDSVSETVRAFPIARTHTFFAEPEKQAKGTGLLFSINVNPDACKACGLCTAVCPEYALEMTGQTPEILDEYGRNWSFAMQVPAPSRDRIDRFIADDEPSTLAYGLLDRRAYHSVVGGDSSFPGSGTRSTLHLMAAIADRIARPKAERFRQAVGETIQDLKGAIRELVKNAVEINDFEEFGRRLQAIESAEIDPAELAHVADEREPVERERLMRLSRALSDLEELLDQQGGPSIEGSTAGMAAAFSLAPPHTNSSSYPYNPFSVPWINVPSGDAPAVAEGVFEGVAKGLIEALRRLRKARRVLNNVVDPNDREPARNAFRWSSLTEEEWDLCPPILAVARTQDEVLPHLLETRLPIKVVVLDRSFPVGGDNSNLRLWPLARPDMFVLRSTIGTPEHLLPGLQIGLSSRRPSLFHLYVSEPAYDGVLPDKTIDSMRRAVESRAFPLLVYDPDRPGEWADRWDLSGNPSIDQDWADQTIQREVGGVPSTRTSPLTVADWAVREGRFRKFFRHVPRNGWHDLMSPLTDFLTMTDEERTGRQPFIEVSTEDHRVARVEVLPEMVSATELGLHSWKLLQELGSIRSSVVERVSARFKEELDEEIEQVRGRIGPNYASRLEAEMQSFESGVHARLTEELLVLSGYGGDSEKARARLSDLARLDRSPDVDLPNGGDQDGRPPDSPTE